ncbi:biotin synthase BioB [Clostridium sp.]|uniref:biotin synthase BioB n=1 Tax=Clostridium sp. TaxID=1506 RepID=UPI0026285534|nr:biotin synthase BioB [Clostridium sp.]
MDFIYRIKEKALNNEIINLDEGIKLYNYDDINLLTRFADDIRKKFHGDRVELCSIINGKSGKCGENCAFCAQSKKFKTTIKQYDLLSYEEVKKVALENEKEGVNRFSIVTSGRGLYGNDLKNVCIYYKRLKEESNIKLCASHGILSKESLIDLKDAGITRYHHNLESSREFYSKICTSHSYEERIKTIKLAKEIGLDVCSGGIIGLGERIKDRVILAITLRELEIKSIPINVLTPIKGTDFEKMEPLKEEEILRTIAVFRFINPKAKIRLAAGRENLENFGQKAFKGGANATITGNLLTTCGNKIKDDIDLIKKVGMRVIDNE